MYGFTVRMHLSPTSKLGYLSFNVNDLERIVVAALGPCCQRDIQSFLFIFYDEAII